MDARRFHSGTPDVDVSSDQVKLRLLIETGIRLNSERDLDGMVQSAADAGRALCGAEWGVFFYSRIGADGEATEEHQVTGLCSEPLVMLLVAGRAALVSSTLSGMHGLRSADITDDERLPGVIASTLSPSGQVHVRSYLAMPVRSRTGDSLGALLYGHAQPRFFTADAEKLVSTIACQVAISIENLRLTDTLSREIALADQARAELRGAERRLRLALDAAELGTWSWRSGSGLIDFDERAAAIFHVQPHTAYSRRDLWQKFIKVEDRSRTPEDLQQLLQHKKNYAAEYRIQMPEGGYRWICANGAPTLDENTGRLVGMTGTLQDITPRKMQEESLRQSEKLAATGRLAATIAHEINNPLEAVTNLIYLAKTDEKTPETVQQMLEMADSELARVSQIAQQTLGFYRDTTRPAEINLNELLKAVVDLFQRKLSRKQLECTMDLEPGLAVIGLQGEIRQVISNLLVNAIDATAQGAGDIHIRGRHRLRNGNHGVSVLISDRGAGIPSHLRERLFTPFFTTKQSLGTGLGLWVTRGMVEKHGGSVCFRSCTNHPSGTIFRVHLPRTAGQQLFAPTPAVLQ